MFTSDSDKPKRFAAPGAPSAPSATSGTTEIDIARSVLEHAVRRMATIEREITESARRTARPSETLLKARDRRLKELVAVCLKFDDAERKHTQKFRRAT